MKKVELKRSSIQSKFIALTLSMMILLSTALTIEILVTMEQEASSEHITTSGNYKPRKCEVSTIKTDTGIWKALGFNTTPGMHPEVHLTVSDTTYCIAISF